MDLERAEQAHDRVWYALGDVRDRGQLGDRSARKAIQPAVHLLEQATLDHTTQISTRDLSGIEVPRTQDSGLRDAKQRAGLAIGHDTQRLSESIMTEETYQQRFATAGAGRRPWLGPSAAKGVRIGSAADVDGDLGGQAGPHRDAGR